MSEQEQLASQDATLALLESATLTAGDMKNLAKRWIKAFHPDVTPSFEEFSREATDRNAERVIDVLGSYMRLESPERWDNPAHNAEGRRVLFPQKGRMDESFVVVVRSPRMFLMLVHLYSRPQGISDDDLEECERVADAVEESDDVPVSPDADHSGEAGELLQSLEEIHSLAEYAAWLSRHEDALHTGVLSSPIPSPRGPSNLRSEIGERVRSIVEERAAGITTRDDFDALRAEADACRLFPTPHVPVTLYAKPQRIRGLVARHVDVNRKALNQILGTAYRELMIAHAEQADDPNRLRMDYDGYVAFKAGERERPRNRRILTSRDMLLIQNAFTRAQVRLGIHPSISGGA